jgi:plasmid maintenance system antidote protein VapI
MALRIGKLLGNGPDLWINLQRAYDLAVAERELAGQIKKYRRSRRRSLYLPGTGEEEVIA